MSENIDQSQPFHNDAQFLSELPSELHSKIQQLLEENDRLQQLLLEKQADSDNLLNELNEVKQSYQDQFIELMEKVDKMGQLIQSQEEHNNEVVNDHKKKTEILRRVQAELQAANEAKDAAIQQAEEAHGQLIEEQNRCALYLENFQNIETQIGYVVSENESLNEAKHALEMTVQQLEEHILQLMEENKHQLKASEILQSQVLQGDLLQLDIVENGGEQNRIEKDKGDGRIDEQDNNKEDLREQIRQLEKEINRLNEENQELNERIEKERQIIQKEQVNQTEENSNNRCSSEETQEQLTKLQSENEQLREQVQHCLGRIASLLSPNGSINHRIDNLTKETSDNNTGKETQKDNNNLSDNNAMLAYNSTSSTDQKDILLDDLRLQIIQLRSESQTYQEQYQAARSDFEHLRLQQQSIESEKQTLLSQVNQLKEVHNNSQLKRQEYSKLISIIENEKLLLKGQLNEKISENEQLNRELLKQKQKKIEKGEEKEENEGIRNLQEQLKQAQNVIAMHAEDLQQAAVQYREAVIGIQKNLNRNGRTKGNSNNSNDNGLEVAQ